MHAPDNLPPRTLLSRRATLTAAAAAVAALIGCAAADRPSRQATTLPTPSPTPTPTPAPSTQPLPAGVVNVLVLGSDTRQEARLERSRADTIVLVQLNPQRNHLNLISVPRDTRARIPGHGRTKINAAYAYGGPDLMRQVVSETLGGVPIHATLETSFERFITLMAVLGPVPVTNRHASHSLGPTFPAGTLNLAGPDSLAFNRERKGLPQGDFDRTERNRATLIGILGTLHTMYATDPNGVQSLVPRLFAQVRATGLTLAQAYGLLPLLKGLSATTVTSLMVPISRSGSLDRLDEGRMAELTAALRTADLTGYVGKYGTTS